LLEVRNLVKKYGDKTALNGVDFHIRSGEVVGLLGLNGAGKSTTMNCITGYIAPTSGTILVGGHDIQKEPDEARSMIGYLPEVFAFYPDMKVREYLDFVCDLKKFSKNRQVRKDHIDKICRKVGIGDLTGRMIRNLSKGYKQRVGFAQALIGDPKVLILDEPTVGLDPSQIIEIRRLIRDSGKESTVIVSSHILSEIQEVCSRILVIHDGHIAADGTPSMLMENAGGQELRICVKDEAQAVKVLQKLSCLEQYDSIPASEPGTFRYRLQGNGKGDLREEVFRAFAGSGISLLELSMPEASLEHIFLRLTGQEAVPAYAAPDDADGADGGKGEPG